MNSQISAQRSGKTLARDFLSRTRAVAQAGHPWMIVTLCGLLAALVYHPYYFGDELQAFFFANDHDGSFLPAYWSFNEYKPRLIFYAFWVGLASLDISRSIAAVATMASLVASAQILSHVIQTQFGGSRKLALVGALVLVTSRFSTVAYFDYLSGTIEAFAMLLFLLVVALTLPTITGSRVLGVRRGATIVGLSVATVLIHERYVAAYVAVGFLLALAPILRSKQRKPDLVSSAWGVLVALLPLATFALATYLVAKAPISTGTAGRQVSVDTEIVWTTLKYLSNVLVGSNFGQPWLVGDAGFPGKRHAALFACLSAAAALLWIAALLSRSFVSDWRRAAFIAVSMLSLCAVASLPGSDHLEGRWLTPVLPLAVLLACACTRGVSRLLIVSMLLTINLAYAAVGSHFAIYNVYTSKTVDTLVSGLESLAPGRNGILLNVPAADYVWPIGGNSFGTNARVTGATFCRVNISSGACIQPPTPELLADIDNYDFALTLRATDPRFPGFKLLDRNEIVAVRSPDSIDLTTLAPLMDEPAKQWRWSKGKPVQPASGVVELVPANVGTRTVPAGSLGGYIVYRVEANSAGVQFRVQVNWADAQGRFLGTSFNVASTTLGTHNYVGILAAPEGANSGEIYATLHDGEKKSVRVLGIWSGKR